MVLSSMGCGIGDCPWGKESATMPTRVSMMASGRKDSHMASVRKPSLMALVLMDAGSRGKQKVMALRCSPMERSSKANGTKVNSWLVSASSQIIRSMMASGTRESLKVMALKSGLMVVGTKEIGIRASQSVRESKLTQMAHQRKESGKVEHLL